MARKPDTPCASCGRLLWRGTGSKPDPVCRDCRKAAPRPRKHSFTKRIGCVEPAWPACWTCGAYMERAHGVRYCSRPCQPSSTKDGRNRTLTCTWCSHTFMGEPNKGHDPTCSRSCQTYINLFKRGYVADPWQPHLTNVWSSKERRRARIRMTQLEPINRTLVFTRDRYRCWICRRPTARTQRVPHPRAPTIDHVVPLSKGGTHTLDNLATACFRCNVRKGDSLEPPWGGVGGAARIGAGLRGGMSLASATGSRFPTGGRQGSQAADRAR